MLKSKLLFLFYTKHKAYNWQGFNVIKMQEDDIKTSCCYLAITYLDFCDMLKQYRSVRNKKKAETQAETKTGRDPEIFAQIAIS